MRVSIHPHFADLVLDLVRNSIEAGFELTPEEDEQYGKFIDSVKDANQRERRKAIIRRAHEHAKKGNHDAR